MIEDVVDYAPMHSQVLGANGAGGYSRNLIRVIRNKLEWKRITALLFIAAVLVYSYWKDGLSWIHGAMGAILLVVAVFAFLLYRNSVRQSNVQLDRMKTPLGQSTLTDESLTISNELGSVTMPWSSFKGMSEYDGFWLLHTSSSNAITIPTAGIDSEVLGFIRQKIPARRTGT